MSWIRIILINFIVFLVLIVLIEPLAGVGRIIIGRQFVFPDFVKFDPCREMRTDVLLGHVPNHQGCIIKGGSAEGEYVRYNVSDTDKPVLITLGGSTTTGFMQDISDGDTYPSYLAKLMVDDYQVLNGGVGGYSSLQELYKVIRDAPRIEGLHTVVSLNGVNDMPDYHGPNEIRRIYFPFLTASQTQMNDEQVWINQSHDLSIQGLMPNFFSLVRALSRIFESPTNINESPTNINELPTNLTVSNPVALDAGDRWLSNVTRMHAILQAQGVQYLVFLQPTMGLVGPQSSPPEGSADEVQFNKLVKRQTIDSYFDVIRSLYSELRQHCSELSYCFDISNEVPPSGNVYNDPRHHNSDGNRMLAEVIAQHLRASDNSN